MTEEKQNEKTSENKVNQGKLCAGLAYFLLGILWYFADDKMKKNEFVKFHVKQGLLLLVLSVAIYVVLAMTALIFLLGPLLNLATLVFSIIGVVNVVNGEKKELPFIGQFSSVFKF